MLDYVGALSRMYMHGETMSEADAFAIIDALEKQIPKKPTRVEEKFLGEKIKAPYCPNCGDSWNCNEFGNAMKFCWECGQAIDWRE